MAKVKWSRLYNQSDFVQDTPSSWAFDRTDAIVPIPIKWYRLYNQSDVIINKKGIVYANKNVSNKDNTDEK